jgi:hypothetical protein
MTIESHRNPSLEGGGTEAPGAAAASGSSNSNSHNAGGGGGGGGSVEQMRTVLGQLSALLPRLERQAGAGPGQ